MVLEKPIDGSRPGQSPADQAVGAGLTRVYQEVVAELSTCLERAGLDHRHVVIGVFRIGVAVQQSRQESAIAGQLSGGQVRAVIQGFGGDQHVVAGRGAHVRRLVEDSRNRLDRDPGKPGHVIDRRSL